MKKQNIRARICKCKGNTSAITSLMSSAISDTDKQDLAESLRCQGNDAEITNTYKTLNNFMKRAIPTLGCYRVEVFKNPMATYEGFDCILIIANGKIIEEFNHES